MGTKGKRNTHKQKPATSKTAYQAQRKQARKGISRPPPKAFSKKATAPSKPPRPQPPIVPYTPSNRVLLVGEGDFSFGASLLTHHGVTSLVATSYDDETNLHKKYPQAAANVAALRERGCLVLHGIDAGKLQKARLLKKKRFDRIVFMFPHVGGLSMDQDRQIRYNQDLLQRFFGSAKELLAPFGMVIVTMFEGEPYQQWNVKALARSKGLRTLRSFKFLAETYPGYKHARTLGNIEGNGGAWKGEDRESRSYMFQQDRAPPERPTKKRKREDSSDDDDDNDDNDDNDDYN